MNELLNHLWQSTFFVAAVALTCLALRSNSPRLRYWLWLAASLKFLVPLSPLVDMGSRVPLPRATPALHATTVQAVSTYFAPLAVASGKPRRPASPGSRELLAAIWAAGALFLLLRRIRQARRVFQAAREATPLPLSNNVRMLVSPAMMEPGVLGIFRPVILLPTLIDSRLTPQQLNAIIAHELHHIRCRDNLTAALHMCVEILFWFHPAVWWIGAKLIEERERDCDQAALRQGSERADYARGIVQVCETYFRSPLPSATGISGSDLKKRIREIMTGQFSKPITFGAKATIAGSVAIALAIPFVVGAVRAQTLPPPPAYTYDVVSVHKTAPGQSNVHIGPGPQGGMRTENTSALTLIMAAYSVQEYQIVGAPGWASSERFDVMFTPDKKEITLAPGMEPTVIQGYLRRNGQRLQAVLRDRFGLILRAEMRELPIYALTQAARGPKLSATAGDKGFPSIQTNGNSQITATNATTVMLAEQLSMTLRQPVHDQTGLTGRYDFSLEWTPEREVSPDQAAQLNNPLAGPSIFTAIAEQLGLKLEAKRGPVQVHVVEKIERPKED